MTTEHNVIPMNVPPPKDPTCAFCERPKSAVKHMFASHDTYKHICGDCVVKATARLKESTA